MEAGRLRIFDAIYNFTLTPEGAEDEGGNNETIRVRIISQLELLRFMEECYATRVNIQTPGPVGLQGLLAAKIRGTKISAIHHTELADYAAERYGTWIRPMAVHLMRCFYHQVDTVISPTQPTTDKLIEEGCIKPGQRVLHLDRWVNTETFHPRHRSQTFWEARGIKNGSKKIKFLYTGRIAPEKNLDVAIDAFKQAAGSVGREDVHFILLGPVQDRKYFDKLKEMCQGYNDCITFAGAMHGEVLSIAYASCEVYLFPAKRDTFGKGPIEAQCSGLSVLVSDEGGPQTVVSEEKGKRTGYVLKAEDVGAFAERMIELARNDDLRAELSRNARRYAEERSAELEGKPYRAVLAPHELPDRYDVTGQPIAQILPPDILAKGVAELAPDEAQKLVSELLARIPDSNRRRISA
jgi:glycosyltransferase involved in cell wall biosynthesis